MSGGGDDICLSLGERSNQQFTKFIKIVIVFFIASMISGVARFMQYWSIMGTYRGNSGRCDARS